MERHLTKWSINKHRKAHPDLEGLRNNYKEMIITAATNLSVKNQLKDVNMVISKAENVI
jgi:hypothetical protein